MGNADLISVSCEKICSNETVGKRENGELVLKKGKFVVICALTDISDRKRKNLNQIIE